MLSVVSHRFKLLTLRFDRPWPFGSYQDKPSFVKDRVKLLLESGMVTALVSLANLDKALLTDTSKELLCRYCSAAPC